MLCNGSIPVHPELHIELASLRIEHPAQKMSRVWLPRWCDARLQVAMLFPHSFWGGLDMFGHIAPCVARRGEYFLFYSYTHISGGESTAPPNLEFTFGVE